jgi:uncharacterized protein YvpB
VSRKDAGRRRSPPLVIWFMLGFLVVVATTSAGLGLLAWQATQQVGVLRAELDALRGEYQAGETHLLALQNTATAMESRLATLEENDPVQQLAALQVAVETASDPQQLADLRASLSQVQTEVSGFQATLDHLSFRIDALEARETLPPEARLTVAPQKQSHRLSCESSAASMVAQYYGVDLSEAEVLAALPLNDNPYLGFRGNVDGRFGVIEDYGVYAGPILMILNSHQELRAWPVEGGLEGIKVAIARGNPVIAWVTYDCRESTPTTATIGGSEVNLVPWQHVVVVTGYTAEGVWANDPWDGKEDFYPTEDFERAMGYFGDMAIEVSRP